MAFRHDPLRRDGVRLVEGPGGGVLLFTMRRIHNLVAFCLPYEFEDVVGEVTGADRIEFDREAAVDLSRRAYKLLRFATGSRRLAERMTPPPPTIRLKRDYELFFPVFNYAHELFALASVPGWREHCRKAACFVSELWAHELPEYLVELLSQFDHVFVGLHHSVDKVAEVVRRPCTYLPLATDVVRFTPYPAPPPRVIDVCNIGRRSAVTHQALLRLAGERRIFYYYDTVAASGTDGKQRTFHVDDASSHRLLLANLLQRSRFFIANRSRANEPEFTRGQDEISGRYYEGAAAGTVMLGVPPQTEEFERQFDWQDAVISLPLDSPDIAHVLSAFDADPARLARISRQNAFNAALRHDWVHRLNTVFSAVGLSPTEGMRLRKGNLEALAASIGAGVNGEGDSAASP